VNISDVILDTVTQFITEGWATDAESINHGECEEFAEEVARQMPGAEAYWVDALEDTDDFGLHKVIYYNGLYYDSLCPKGAVHWRTLVR